jgi:hypothetical protein
MIVKKRRSQNPNTVRTVNCTLTPFAKNVKINRENSVKSKKLAVSTRRRQDGGEPGESRQPQDRDVGNPTFGGSPPPDSGQFPLSERLKKVG